MYDKNSRIKDIATLNNGQLALYQSVRYSEFSLYHESIFLVWSMKYYSQCQTCASIIQMYLL